MVDLLIKDNDLEANPEDIPDEIKMPPPSKNPTYILLCSSKRAGVTVVVGSVPSEIYLVIRLREGIFSPVDIRVKSDLPYFFSAFASPLSPMSLMQLLYMFGYKCVTCMEPPLDKAGIQMKVWTLESTPHLHRTKTYAACLKNLVDLGYKMGVDQRVVSATRDKTKDFYITTAQHSKRVLDYILREKRLKVDIFVEESEEVRNFLKKRTEKINKNWEALSNIWSTPCGRWTFVQEMMEPFKVKYQLSGLVPESGLVKNPLVTLEPSHMGRDKGPAIRAIELPKQRAIIAKVKADVAAEMELDSVFSSLSPLQEIYPTTNYPQI